jgi:hypothetical protein
MLDVFRDDAFTVRSLTAAINKAPYQPGRIGSLGLFRESGMTTTTAMVEEKDGQLSLISAGVRGGPPSVLGGSKRTARPFAAIHLSRESQINADEVQGVRAFGEETVLQTVQGLINERLAELRAMHEVTLEHLRVGAIQGIVLDADGSTPIVNLFTEFSVSQQTATLDFTSSDLRSQVVTVQRLIEVELGAAPIASYRAFCGDAFFDALIESAIVKETLKYQEGRVLREDLRKGFEFGGVTWENYRGTVGAVSFFASSDAYVVPITPGIFIVKFAPADFIETVNTLGLPLYAKQAPDQELNRFVKLHTQSNPLALCLRPRAVVKLSYAT